MRIGLDADDNTNTTRRLLFLLESVPLLGRRAHRAAPRRSSTPTSTPTPRTAGRRGSCSTTSCATGARSASTSRARRGRGRASGRCATRSCARRGRCSSPAGCCPSWPATTSSPTRSSPSCCRPWPATDRPGRPRLPGARRGRRRRAHARRLRPLPGAHRRPGAAGRLEALDRDAAPAGPVFQEARRLGREVQQGLLALLFEREPLRRLVRQYLVGV